MTRPTRGDWADEWYGPVDAPYSADWNPPSGAFRLPADLPPPGAARRGEAGSEWSEGTLYGRPRGASRPRRGRRRGAAPAGDGAAGGGLGRAGGSMAAGTVVSRATGFLRTAAIAAAIGTGTLGDAYNVANTTPNILYDLLLGGVLSSVIVPVIVRASREDEDGGERFASALLTLVMLVLGIIVVVGLLAAPLVVGAYLHSGGAERDLAVTFTRWFLPQVLFYGVGATVGAILNVRGSFVAPMITPVLNNIVMIVICVVFIVLPGPRPPGVGNISGTQTTVLGLGTTFGVVVMTIGLFPALRRVGFRYRPVLDLREPRLRAAARLGGWTFLYVVVTQVGYNVTVQLATGTTAYTKYTYAYQLFQLPYAIVAVSIITALLPRMSAHASQGRLSLVRDDVTRGLRTTAVVLIPAALVTYVLARPIATAAFRHGAVTLAGAQGIGSILAMFAVAMVPFAAMQVQLRGFYAQQDTRTPALLNVGVTVLQIVAGLVLSGVTAKDDRGIALAGAFTLAYAVGAVGAGVLLTRRLTPATTDDPGDPEAGYAALAQLSARVTVAGGVAAVLAAVVAAAARGVLGPGVGGSVAGVVLGVAAAGPAFVAISRRMDVGELDRVIDAVRSRLPGR